MNRLIINADDFGLNKKVNEAIMAAMDSDICMDTTMLVNFEDSEVAAKLAISLKRIENIGIHLNLTEGVPLTKKIRNESLFCDANGLFNNKKTKRIYQLTKSEKLAVHEEITSQIQLCRKFGIPISHADSHNHIHEEPGLFSIIIDILKIEKIPFLRLTNNLGKTAYIKKLYRNTYNLALKNKGFAATDYFGSTSDLANYNKRIAEDSITELMIHPGEIIDNQIQDVYAKENLSVVLPEIIQHYKLTSYSQMNM